MQMHPYILNINEDAQLSGVVKLFIQEGTSVRLSLVLNLNGFLILIWRELHSFKTCSSR